MHPEPKYSTEYYIALFHQGDERGLNFIFKKFYRLMVCYANQRVNNWQVAEEIASDAFLKIWPQHHKLQQLVGIKAYLLKIVERDCIRAVQKENRHKSKEQLSISLAQENDNVFHTLVKAETYNLLCESIRKLSPGMRAVMESIYIHGNSPSETAKLLNLNTSTVDTQKKRAIKAIQKLLLRLSVLLSIYLLLY